MWQKPRGCREVTPSPALALRRPLATPRGLLAQVSAASRRRLREPEKRSRGASARLSLDVPICEVGGGPRLLPDPALFAPETHTGPAFLQKVVFVFFK